MDASGWIKNCTAKISNAIGGGSELFTRQGEEYRLDVDFVCRRISEMRERQHNAMHKAVKAERALAAKDAVIQKYREAQEAEWQPISTCPYRDPVDLWCVYGGEEFAQFEGGASIGRKVSDRFKTQEYGFFGNQSNDGVPQRDGPDLVPVAWRRAIPQCPAALIAEALGIPLTLDAALNGGSDAP
jgi:hypothetical protein